MVYRDFSIVIDPCGLWMGHLSGDGGVFVGRRWGILSYGVEG